MVMFLLSFVKGSKSAEGGKNPLADMDPGGPILGGSKGKVTCPVTVTERLIKLLAQSSSAFPLVRRIVKARSKEYFHSSLGVSVSTLREEFK